MSEDSHHDLSQKITAQMDEKLEQGARDSRQKITLACRMLAHEGHSETLAGQITVRQQDGSFLMTAMAIGFDEITRSNMIRIDDEMQVIEGKGMANPAIRFHLWIYRQRPDVNCIVHTHPPYINALSMAGTPLEVAHMDATPSSTTARSCANGRACRSAIAKAKSFQRRWDPNEPNDLAGESRFFGGDPVAGRVRVSVHADRAGGTQPDSRAVGRRGYAH